jgi:hypothetical protein
MKRLAAIALGAAAVAALVLFLVLRGRATPASVEPPTSAANAASDAANAAGATGPATRHDAGGSVAQARVILSVPWGAAAGQLGRRGDPESMAEGPMSFFVDGHGVVILDNVNRRVARFDIHGRPLPPLPLDSEAAQDVARLPHDRVAVLDRLRDRRVTFYGADGNATGRVPLVGTGIAEAPQVTGLFPAADGALYAEREHGAWLRLADADGRPAASRASAPGRPTRAGRFVAAALVDRAAGRARVRVYDDVESAPAWERTIDFGAPIMFLALADGDAAGRIYVGAHTGHESPRPPYRIEDESLTLVALTADGAEAGRLTLPAPPPREESFRDLYVGDDGTIFWMRRTAAGVVVEAYRL